MDNLYIHEVHRVKILSRSYNGIKPDGSKDVVTYKNVLIEIDKKDGTRTEMVLFCSPEAEIEMEERKGSV